VINTNFAWGQLSESDLEGAVTIFTNDAQGSAFFISDTEMLTAAHVVGTAREIRIPSKDGVEDESGVVSIINRECDVALIKVQESTRNTLKLSDSSVEIGESVFAIGSPIGRPVLSAGKVEEINNLFLTTTVPVDSGSSGGPLLTADRQVVGIVVQKNLLGNAIAVPIGRANQCLEQAQEIKETPNYRVNLSTPVVALSGLAIFISVISLFVSLLTLIRLREKRKPIVITLPTEKESER
jgi:S1-C subfamily serine protease